MNFLNSDEAPASAGALFYPNKKLEYQLKRKKGKGIKREKEITIISVGVYCIKVCNEFIS